MPSTLGMPYAASLPANCSRSHWHSCLQHLGGWLNVSRSASKSSEIAAHHRWHASCPCTRWTCCSSDSATALEFLNGTPTHLYERALPLSPQPPKRRRRADIKARHQRVPGMRLQLVKQLPILWNAIEVQFGRDSPQLRRLRSSAAARDERTKKSALSAARLQFANLQAAKRKY